MAFGLLFGIYWVWLRKLSVWKLNEIWLFAICLRVVLLFSVPNLSDDFYRFVWDGHLVSHGENPYLTLPSEYEVEDAADRLYLKKEAMDRMNSANYYTVYPPASQFLFGAASVVSGNHLSVNVFVLKLFLLLAEIFTIWVMIRLLGAFKMNKRLVALYAFNPLIVIEIVGNIHF